jgi:hypothetical protein
MPQITENQGLFANYLKLLTMVALRILLASINDKPRKNLSRAHQASIDAAWSYSYLPCLGDSVFFLEE